MVMKVNCDLCGVYIPKNEQIEDISITLEFNDFNARSRRLVETNNTRTSCCIVKDICDRCQDELFEKYEEFQKEFNDKFKKIIDDMRKDEG